MELLYGIAAFLIGHDVCVYTVWHEYVLHEICMYFKLQSLSLNEGFSFETLHIQYIQKVMLGCFCEGWLND